MIRKLTVAAATAATALLVSSAAHAQNNNGGLQATTAADTSSDGSGASAALLLGFGFGSQDSVNPYGLGFGVRGGYTLPMHLYIGGTFIYHLGASVNGGGSVNVFYVGPEVGYEFVAGPVMIRPYVGIGIAEAKASVNIPSTTVDGMTFGGSSASATSSNVALWPGATVLYPVTSNIAVGADARFVIVSDYNALSLFLTGQYHF